MDKKYKIQYMVICYRKRKTYHGVFQLDVMHN
jgi:hypothetical protein